MHTGNLAPYKLSVHIVLAFAGVHALLACLAPPEHGSGAMATAHPAPDAPTRTALLHTIAPVVVVVYAVFLRAR